MTSATVLGCLPGHAQQAPKRVAYLSPVLGRNDIGEEFEHALERLGWKLDRSIEIEHEYAGGRQENIGPTM